MTILDKWKEISQQIVESYIWDMKTYLNGYQHFEEAFAVDEEDLPLLCILQVKEFHSYQDLVQHHYHFTEEAWTKCIRKLLWLGWIVPAIAHSNERTYTTSPQYHKRLHLWVDAEWQESEIDLQPTYPSEGDMPFPMKKEVYERKLEKLSDDLQGEQLNYFEGCMFEDELDEEDLQLMEKQKAFVTSLLQLYQTWKEYIPKYYRE